MLQVEEFMRAQEHEFIHQPLQPNGYQIGITADATGISRNNMRERTRRLAIG
jgi:DNA-binding NtrC family response regulator